MTDVREPEPLVELEPLDDVRPTLEAEARPVPELRTTSDFRAMLVSRALAPIRRVTGRDLAPILPGRTSLDDTGLRQAEKPKFNLIRWSFIGVVVIPILCCGVYLFLIAKNQYVSEARFAILQPATSGSSGESGGGGGGGGGSPLTGSANLGGQDAEIVASYIHSRAIVEDVGRTIDIRAIFTRPEADFLARLPQNATPERLTAYWNKMVSVYIESSSGIVTVSVSSFRREDSLALVNAILTSSTALVNGMSGKIRIDATNQAEGEVRRSEGEVRFALANLMAFRNAQHVINPMLQSESTGKLLLGLMTQRIQTESTLFVAQRAQGPNAPGLSVVRDKLTSINSQIKDLQDQLSGNEKASANMAALMTSFEELEIKKQFAERMYGFARDGVERARVNALRQAIYLAVFVPASLPEDFSYPLRVTDFSLISLASVMLWLSGLTIGASILDHQL